MSRFAMLCRMPICRSVVTFLGTVVTSSILKADLVTISPSRDNTLYESPDGSLSNGAGTAMFAGRNSATSNSRRRALIQFDIAGAVPAGSTIDQVTLSLWNDAANVNADTIRLHRVMADWGEGASVGTGNQGGGAPAAPGDATWLHQFHNTQTWTLPGGDFDVTASASTVVAGPGGYMWPSTADWVADVQHFLDQPSLNFGWLLMGNEAAAGSAKRFATREEPDPLRRPVLTIEYTPVPEPGSAVIWLMAFGLVAKRRD